MREIRLSAITPPLSRPPAGHALFNLTMRRWAFLCLGLWLGFDTSSTRAQGTSFGLSWDGSFVQTSADRPNLSTGTFGYGASVGLAANSGITTATVLTPPGAGETLSLIAPNQLAYTEAGIPTFTALAAEYPFTGAIYQFQVGRQLTDFTVAQALFPNLIPAVDAKTFANLQTYDPAQRLTLSWTPYASSAPVATSQVIVTDANGGVVFQRLFTRNNASSVTLDPNLLQPNATYRLTLNFSQAKPDRLEAESTNASFAYATNLTFTTVPEPGSVSLLAAGVVLVAAAAWQQRRKVKALR